MTTIDIKVLDQRLDLILLGPHRYVTAGSMSQPDKVQESLDLYLSLRALWHTGQGDTLPDQALKEHNQRMAAIAEELFDGL